MATWRQYLTEVTGQNISDFIGYKINRKDLLGKLYDIAFKKYEKHLGTNPTLQNVTRDYKELSRYLQDEGFSIDQILRIKNIIEKTSESIIKKIAKKYPEKIDKDLHWNTKSSTVVFPSTQYQEVWDEFHIMFFKEVGPQIDKYLKSLE
jgi:hypothetical protein